MSASYDILGLGCTAVDEILYVPAYPLADAKVEVERRERHCGGLTATALVAASRLGARCTYAGTLGEDESSQLVLDTFRREGVETRFTVKRNGAGPVRSVIVVEEARRTRTIFYHTRHAFGAAPTHPPRKVIENARVLLVDRFGIPGMIRAARIARGAGIPVVADFESHHLPRFAELLALADHLIVAEGFARALTGAKSTPGALAKLARDNRVVVATCGAAGCWFLEGASGPPRHFPAFRVKAIDTTGCGDVFHGAYAAALAREMSLLERLRFASAAAALKATRRGGQAGIPTLAKVKAFLRKYPA